MIADNLKDNPIDIEIEDETIQNEISIEVDDINYIPGYKTSELERRTNETQRLANETQREHNETQRQTNEVERQDNEVIRQTNENNRQNYISNLEIRVEQGDFDGKDGVDGQDGQDGYTPIKGIDYFTTEDINSLKNTFVDLDNAQTITAKKTFNILPESSVAPTTNNQLVNKSYVDGLVGNINTVLATLTTIGGGN